MIMLPQVLFLYIHLLFLLHFVTYLPFTSLLSSLSLVMSVITSSPGVSPGALSFLVRAMASLPPTFSDWLLVDVMWIGERRRRSAIPYIRIH